LEERIQDRPLQERMGELSLSRWITYTEMTSKYVSLKGKTVFNKNTEVPYIFLVKGKLKGSFYREARSAKSPCSICSRLNKTRPFDSPRIECIIADSFDCCATCLCLDIPCEKCNWKSKLQNMPPYIKRIKELAAKSPPRYCSNTRPSSKRSLEEEEEGGLQIKGIGNLSSSTSPPLRPPDPRKRQKSVHAEDTEEISQTDTITPAEEAINKPVIHPSTQDVIMLEENVQGDDKLEEELVKDKVEPIDEIYIRSKLLSELKCVLKRKEEEKRDFLANEEEALSINEEEAEQLLAKEEEMRTICDELINGREELKEGFEEKIVILESKIKGYEKKLTKQKTTIKDKEETIKRGKNGTEELHKNINGLKEELIRERRSYKERLKEKQNECELEKQQKENNEKTIKELHKTIDQMEFDQAIQFTKVQNQISSLQEAKMYYENNAKSKIEKCEEQMRQRDSIIKELLLKVEQKEKENEEMGKERNKCKEELIIEKNKNRDIQSELITEKNKNQDIQSKFESLRKIMFD